jgi:hypothetical protein
MKSIVNNTSSPFKLTFQSSRGAQGGAYENVPTTATYGSNEATVEAIAGIGKVAGSLIKAERANEEADKIDTKAKINKITKKTEDKKPTDIEVKSGEDFSKAISDQIGGSISDKSKKARGLSDIDFSQFMRK